MKKHIFILSLILILGIVIIPISVSAKDDPQIILAKNNEWGNDLENIMITIETNKDVDQIILKSQQGEFLLTPETHYSENDLLGNNEIMDMNGDLEVNQKDYSILEKHINEKCKNYTNTVRCSHCGASDINDDGIIDDADLEMLDKHINHECTLEDCYFHGSRIFRKENDTGYTWFFHYTPTIEGADTMTLTPQAVTSTNTRNGEPQELIIKAEEFKNPEILRSGVTPNQNKYYIGSTINIYAVTPLETDKVIFKTNNETLTAETWDSIDYDKSEKTWKQTFQANQAGIENIKITGYGKQSNDQFISGAPTTLKKQIVDPTVIACNTRISNIYVERWTTTSTDEEGNVTTHLHSRNWYTHTATATCNSDTDYVRFSTPQGNAFDYSYSTSGENYIFSTSWTVTSSGGNASANPYAQIIIYPSQF